MSKRCDNADIEGKIGLRRYCLKRWHKDRSLRVVDACSGYGRVWTELGKEWDLTSWLRLDARRIGPGIIKIDSRRWLSGISWDADVLDIDTYGEPWRLLQSALYRELTHSLSIFLTDGKGWGARGGWSLFLSDLAGIPARWRDRIPHSCPLLRAYLDGMAIRLPMQMGWRINEAFRQKSRFSEAVYWGLRVSRDIFDHVGDGQ